MNYVSPPVSGARTGRGMLALCAGAISSQIHGLLGLS
jgi:hypothetical protein